jgi:ABC-type phosphate/phosphonate transport system permease subunit
MSIGDINIRMATIIGFAGVGIGLTLQLSLGLQYHSSTVVLLLL